MSTITKRADFVENALRTIKDKSHLMDSPFETIFGAMLPMVLWPTSKMLSALLFVAEVLGYGPGLLGRLIDKALGFGTGSPNLSDESLKGAATGTIDTILSKLGMRAESMIRDLYMVKSSIEMHDLVAIAAYVKQNPATVKIAYPGRASFLRRFLLRTSQGGRLGLINGLWWILKTFAKGLIGLGIAGGLIGKGKELLQPGGAPGMPGRGLEGLFPPSGEAKPLLMERGPTDLYLNVKQNVEDTLIHFLDSAYKLHSKSSATYVPFSKMFQELNGYPLRGSAEMRDVLKIVGGLNWGEVSQIDSKRTFVGPVLETIAKRLIPVMQLESEEVKPTEGSKDKDLLQALRGVYK